MRPTSSPSSDTMEIRYFDTLPSTSKTAAEAAKEGAGHLYTVVAATQTAGRGRLQRRFHSPSGGLYFSTVLRTALTPAQYGAVTPFAAVAVARAVCRVCGVQPEIKWVNDLLLRGKKICGILAESGVDTSGEPYIILGIGINTGDTAFPPELQEIADNVPCRDKDALLRTVLAELEHVEEEILRGTWLTEYRAHSAILGREVLVIEGEARRLVTALDILENGALLILESDGRQVPLCGGEISLRLTQ